MRVAEVGPNELSELSAPPFSPKVVLGPTSEVGKWPDQNGQSRLSAPVSEFVEAGEPIERRSPKENVTVTTSWIAGGA